MKINVGIPDRVIRTILGVVMVAAGFYFESLWGLVGVIPLVSGLSGLCPLYAVFGLSSCPKAAVGTVKNK